MTTLARELLNLVYGCDERDALKGVSCFGI